MDPSARSVDSIGPAAPAGGGRAREPGVDLARIAAIALVCLAHVVKAGGVESAAGGSGFAAYAVQFLCAVSFASVNIFAMVSGWLLATSKSLRAGRYVRLYLDVWTIGLASAVAASAITGISLHAGDWRGIALPLTRNAYWYFTAYTVLFPLVPLLAAGLGVLSARTVRGIVLALFALFCLPSVYAFTDPFLLKRGYSALWLLALFLAGAHLRLHVPRSRHPWRCLAGALLCAAWTVAFFALERNAPWALRAFGPRNPFLAHFSPSTTAVAFLLFRFFVSLDLRPEGLAARFGRFFAPTAFGVYLWQTQPFTFRNLFRGSFRALGELPGPAIPFAAVAAACGLFLVLAFVEKARIWLFERIGRMKRFLVPASVLVLAILSGAAFGDNCAPVSDTTIIAATSQEYKYIDGTASIGGAVKSRYKYVLIAGGIAIVLFLIFGGSGGVIDPAEAETLLSQNQRPMGLLLLIPTCVVIVMAVKGINIFACLGTGSVLAIIIGLAAGLFKISDLIYLADGKVQGTITAGVAACDTAFRSVEFALKGVHIDKVHGINGATAEDTMRNMGLIASPGMVGTEKTIVEIFENKLR